MKRAPTMVKEAGNPMELESIDIGRVIDYRNFISYLTFLDFSAYDDHGRLLVPSISEDPLLGIFTASEAGRREHAAFVESAVRKAVVRKGVSIFKGPANQYHCFIPVQAGAISLVFVRNAFYVSANDIEDLELKGSAYGLSLSELRAWAKSVVVSELGEVSEECENVSHLLNLAIGDMHERTLHMERYRRTRIIMDLLFEIADDMDEYKIYNLLSDAILFLFGGETVSILLRSHDAFAPILVKGRCRDKVERVALRESHPPLSYAIQQHKALVCTEAFELLRLGYPEEITTLHAFPIATKDETLGLLGVFNSFLIEEDIENISKLCGLIGLIVNTSRSQKTYTKHLDDMTAMDFAAMGTPAFRDPDTLYESIVEISSRLMNTEKVSLMLPEDGQQELLIKAVKGINKWIANKIRVKIGEGICGRVYKEGRPLTAAVGEEILSPRKSNYKTRSFVSIPLKIGDEAIGVLNLTDRTETEAFSEEDVKFLQHFASCASVAIKGAQCYHEMEEMRTLSITDFLTGLFNRRYFDHRLFEELQRAIRYDSFFSLAILDIDDFKLFNDQEGHLAGDAILKAVGAIARESLRSIDILSRFGGEEFAIIMPQTERDEAILVAERTRKNITNLIPVSWKNFPREKITVSIGIATFPSDGKDAKTLITNADKALYKAKVSGKDRTVAGDAPPM